MTDRRPLDIAEVKAAANDRMSSVLAKLGINDKPRGNRGTIALCDPVTKDKNPSLVIWTGMAGGLSWKRYGSDAHGDIIQLVAYLKGWWDLRNRGAAEARRWLIDNLGLGAVDPARIRADAARSRRREAEHAKRQAEQLAADRGRAKQQFLHAAPLAGTLGEDYLRARGIDFALLPKGPRGGNRTPGYIRFLANERHVDKEGRETSWPCLIACCVDPVAGEIGAVHRTWLARDGAGKALVTPQRKVWPAFAGLVLPIWRGESALSVREAIAAGLRETLVLTEGNEDGLSAVLAAPQCRTWGIISLNNLVNLRLPECIDGVMIHRQNEWVNAQAVAAFEAGKRALERQGVPVSEIHAFAGKDLNDTLRGAA